MPLFLLFDAKGLKKEKIKMTEVQRLLETFIEDQTDVAELAQWLSADHTEAKGLIHAERAIRRLPLMKDKEEMTGVTMYTTSPVSYSSNNRYMVVSIYKDKQFQLKLAPAEWFVSDRPRVWESGKVIHDREQFLRHSNQDTVITNIFLWEYEERFLITFAESINTQMIRVSEKHNGKDVTQSFRMKDVTMNPEDIEAKRPYIHAENTRTQIALYKDTGKITLRSGDMKYAVQVNRTSYYNKKVEQLLRLVPAAFLERMQDSLEAGIPAYVLEELGYRLKEVESNKEELEDEKLPYETASMQEIHRFRTLAALRLHPGQVFLPNALCVCDGVNFTAAVERKIDQARSGVEAMQVLYPNMGKKALRRTLSDKSIMSRSYDSQRWYVMPFVLYMLKDPNDINAALKEAKNVRVTNQLLVENKHYAFSRLKRLVQKVSGGRFLSLLEKEIRNETFFDPDRTYPFLGNSLPGSVNLILDTLRMMTQIDILSGRYPEQLDVEEELDRQEVKNLLGLHDALARIHYQYEDATYGLPISYTEKERQLEWEEDGYSFKLAESKRELNDIGKKMNICVGSYGSEAFAKELTILTVQSAAGYDVCVEIRKKKIVQVKKRFNERINPTSDAKLHACFKKWVQRSELKLDTNDFVG